MQALLTPSPRAIAASAARMTMDRQISCQLARGGLKTVAWVKARETGSCCLSDVHAMLLPNCDVPIPRNTYRPDPEGLFLFLMSDMRIPAASIRLAAGLNGETDAGND